MIKDTDNSEQFLSQLKQITAKEIHVGILSKADAKLQVIAAANEWGAVIKSSRARRWLFSQMAKEGIEPKKGKFSDGFIHIPERAAIRKAFDDGGNITKVFQDGQASWNKTGDLMQAVNAMGSSMVGKVQESYLSNIMPENHPFTIARKGSAKTLIDEGRLIKAVSYEIV